MKWNTLSSLVLSATGIAVLMMAPGIRADK